ncbi:S1 RNA-binding domain-containing protein [Oscillospiraceae bacterium PP1C4]
MSIYRPEGMLIDTIANQQAFKSFSSLQEAYASGKILESRAIVCDSEHNLIVDMGIFRGIIPREEGALGIAEGTTRDIAIISKVNKSVCYRITGFHHAPDDTVIPQLSRRAVQQDCLKNYIMKLTPGDIIDAKVTHLESFGCFVDIGCGIPSLIPIDAISISRISHPRDRFHAAQEIKAIVKSVGADGRVSLSHKELLGTWNENAALFRAGETVAGIVRSVEDYGVFVELTPNLAGLAEPREGIAAGQHASVYIKSLISEKMKAKLIIVDAFDATYRSATSRYFLTEGHIDRWQYSPDSSDRLIETVFN